jgi:outer membrane murein-binding lipoprotein Lpp
VNEILIAVIPAVITGGITLAGILIANGKSQAVTETKIDELTREVREHNNFARRVPVVEEQIKVINHRIKDLEDAEKHDD